MVSKTSFLSTQNFKTVFSVFNDSQLYNRCTKTVFVYFLLYIDYQMIAYNQKRRQKRIIFDSELWKGQIQMSSLIWAYSKAHHWIIFLIWCLWFDGKTSFMIRILVQDWLSISQGPTQINNVCRFISKRYPGYHILIGRKILKLKLWEQIWLSPDISQIKSMIHAHATWRTINIARRQSLDCLVKSISMITWIILYIIYPPSCLGWIPGIFRKSRQIKYGKK